MDWPERRRPAFATRLLCDVAAERGIDPATLLAGADVAVSDLHDPSATVSAADEIVAVRRLLALLPDAAGLGVDAGSRATLTDLGLFGFAVMSCATLRELFTITMRYFALTMLQIDIKLFEVGDFPSQAGGVPNLMMEVNADHLPADVRGFFIERDVAGIIAAVNEFASPLILRYADQMTVELSVGEHTLAPVLAPFPLKSTAFERAHNRMYFPRAMFDERLPRADPHTLELCLAQCDILMQRIEQRRGITAVVRSKVFRDSGRFPTLPEVAGELSMHPRTLRRHLAEEGTSFRALLNEARATVAADLLRHVGLTVEEVSKRLGYTDVSTFSHAFKRWHGMPPSAYRPQTRRTG